MNQRIVQFGIIGTGAIAEIHAEALSRASQAKLVAVYDQNPTRSAAFSERHNCRAAADLTSFLASDVEAVTIATPSGLHAEVAIPAARAGKHILCEKPLEVTTAKIDLLIAACEEAGVLLSAVFQSRFAANVRLIKQAVDAGRFGTPVFAAATMQWYRTPEYYNSASWRGTMALDGGGALMNQGIHTVDLLLHLNGEVAEVSCHTARRLHHGIEVEDTAAALLRFANGSFGAIAAGTACAPGFPRRVELVGTGGSVTLEDDRITRWVFAEERPEDAAIRAGGGKGEGITGGSSRPNAMSCEGHRRQIEELAAAILERRPLSVSGREGRRAVELITACYESAASGQPVILRS
ncbi:MAG: Gfo/Idh/MocA family protein [Victivallaceae bacterium]